MVYPDLLNRCSNVSWELNPGDGWPVVSWWRAEYEWWILTFFPPLIVRASPPQTFVTLIDTEYTISQRVGTQRGSRVHSQNWDWETWYGYSSVVWGRSWRKGKRQPIENGQKAQLDTHLNDDIAGSEHYQSTKSRDSWRHQLWNPMFSPRVTILRPTLFLWWLRPFRPRVKSYHLRPSAVLKPPSYSWVSQNDAEDWRKMSPLAQDRDKRMVSYWFTILVTPSNYWLMRQTIMKDVFSKEILLSQEAIDLAHGSWQLFELDSQMDTVAKEHWNKHSTSA